MIFLIVTIGTMMSYSEIKFLFHWVKYTVFLPLGNRSISWASMQSSRWAPVLRSKSS